MTQYRCRCTNFLTISIYFSLILVLQLARGVQINRQIKSDTLLKNSRYFHLHHQYQIYFATKHIQHQHIKAMLTVNEEQYCILIAR